jgi:hypothetical protein
LTSCVDENIVWGTDDTTENIVWGTADGDENIVWGTDDGSENIVWGTDDTTENIVWGTSTLTGSIQWSSATSGFVSLTDWTWLLRFMTDDQIFALLGTLDSPPPLMIGGIR